MTTTTYRSDQSIKSGHFDNFTVILDKQWHDVTCHNNLSQGWYDFPPTFPRGVAMLAVQPANKDTWSKIVDCAGDAKNITIQDTGHGCAAFFYTDPYKPGVANKCITDSNGFIWSPQCATNAVNYGCEDQPLPSDVIASYMAPQPSSTSSTMTSTSTSSVVVSAPTASKTGAASRGRTPGVGRLELVLASLLLLSMVFGSIL